jgi:hypothetical protein
VGDLALPMGVVDRLCRSDVCRRFSGEESTTTRRPVVDRSTWVKVSSGIERAVFAEDRG